MRHAILRTAAALTFAFALASCSGEEAQAPSRMAVVLKTVAACIFGRSSCGGGDPAVPPPRPANVPEAAVWSGGVDGGNWFVCAPLDVEFRYRCQVYNDHAGTLVADGEFVLRHVRWDRQNEKPIVSDIRGMDIPPYVFDGEEIRVEGSLVLEPVPSAAED